MTKKAVLRFKNRPVSYWLTPMNQEQLTRLRAGMDLETESDQSTVHGKWRAYKCAVALAVVAPALVAVSLLVLAPLLHRAQPGPSEGLPRTVLREILPSATLGSPDNVQTLTRGQEYVGSLPGISVSTTPYVVFHIGRNEIRGSFPRKDGTFLLRIDDYRGFNYVVAIPCSDRDPGTISPESWFGPAASQALLLKELRAIAKADDKEGAQAKELVKQFLQPGKDGSLMSVMPFPCKAE